MILGPLHVFLHLAALGVMVWPYPYDPEAPRIPPPSGAGEALVYAVMGDERGSDR